MTKQELCSELSTTTPLSYWELTRVYEQLEGYDFDPGEIEDVLRVGVVNSLAFNTMISIVVQSKWEKQA